MPEKTTEIPAGLRKFIREFTRKNPTFSFSAIAKELKIPFSVVRECAHPNALALGRKRGSKVAPSKRNLQILSKIIGGATMPEVGEKHRITRARVQQIAKKFMDEADIRERNFWQFIDKFELSTMNFTPKKLENKINEILRDKSKGRAEKILGICSTLYIKPLTPNTEIVSSFLKNNFGWKPLSKREIAGFRKIRKRIIISEQTKADIELMKKIARINPRLLSSYNMQRSGWDVQTPQIKIRYTPTETRNLYLRIRRRYGIYVAALQSAGINPQNVYASPRHLRLARLKTGKTRRQARMA